MEVKEKKRIMLKLLNHLRYYVTLTLILTVIIEYKILNLLNFYIRVGIVRTNVEKL